VRAVLDDVEAAPVSEPLRATLRMLGTLTREPQRFGPADVRAVKQHGVSDGAIADAMYICAAFNIIDRCADSLSFAIPENYNGRILLEKGYLAAIGED
jgi:alkylhydroperoxidase family enzyme